MTDTLSLEADPYHTLAGRDRDHLLAAAIYTGKHGEIPPASSVNEAVGRLTGSTPSTTTTDTALATLADAGLIERVQGEPHGAANGVRVTDAGRRALDRGAARLDAAATVEGDA